MSLRSLHLCVTDQALRNRVLASCIRIARDPTSFGVTNGAFSGHVRDHTSHAESALDRLMWEIALDNEAGYETLVNATGPVAPEWQPSEDTPGMGSSITDTIIQNAVLANWPDGT
jgi:hypothetical protein